MRTSSYTIYVDIPDSYLPDGETDRVLLVHGFTGAYDKVSKRVADYLRYKTEGPSPKPLYGVWPKAESMGPVDPPPTSVVDALVKRGYLTSKTEEEEHETVEELTKQLHHWRTKQMPSYIIMPTYECNLRCPYCFQSEMRTDPAKRSLLKIMDADMVDRIVKAMPEIEAIHGINYQEEEGLPRAVTFFGGEPLLEETYPTVKYLMTRLQEQGSVRFSAISNATELHHYKDLIGPGKIAQIQVTLDGPPDEHDQRRVYTDGSGSWERIRQNVHMALDKGTHITIRTNVDRNNIDDLTELAEVIHGEGWPEYSNFSAYVAPIHEGNDETDANELFNSWELRRKLGKMQHENPRLYVLGRPDDNIKSRLRNMFASRTDPLPSYRSSFCSAHDRMYILDAFGDVYACWERTGSKDIRMGHLEKDGSFVIDNKLQTLWRGRTISSNPYCRKCKYAYYCGGGCAVLAEAAHDTIYSNYCDGFQKRFRAAAAEAYIEFTRTGSRVQQTEPVCST